MSTLTERFEGVTDLEEALEAAAACLAKADRAESDARKVALLGLANSLMLRAILLHLKQEKASAEEADLSLDEILGEESADKSEDADEDEADEGEEDTEEAILAELESVVEQTTPLLPLELDALTKLVGVEAGPGLNFSYRYTLALKDVPREGLPAIRNELAKGIQERWEDESLADLARDREFRDRGVTFHYIYQDPSGRRLFSINVSPE